MKRILFVIASFIFCLSACNKTGNSVVEQTNEVKAEEIKIDESKAAKEELENNNGSEKKDSFQTLDPMRSDYKESDSDGYSWRYRDCTYDKNDRVLTKEKLLSTSWSMDSEVNQYYILCFYTDDVFKAGTRQAGVNCIGTYEVRDGKVFMKTTGQYDIGIEQYFPASEEEYYGDFHPYSDSVIFSHELVINGYRFFPGNCYKEDGESALVQDIPLVVESKKAIVTDNVKLRSGPGTNYKQLDCYLTINLIAEGYPNSRIERPAPLLKYSDFHTLGHTLKKDKIGDDEAYWYYIVYSDGFESSYNAWIYGAWIEDFDESLSDDYWKKWWELAKEKYNLKQYDEP